MKQSDIFLESEATEWFLRNQDQLTEENDPVIEAIEGAKIKPADLLEVGCSNGWRVKAMQKRWKCDAYGIDPFFKTTLWNCRKGTADNLHQFPADRFDMVIYGWCLYLCDREDLFTIASEGDRVLRENGYLVIYDFDTDKSYKRKYKHYDGLYSYKMNYSRLWLGNPTYSLYHRFMHGAGEDRTSVTILKKSTDSGWPLHD